ncbi:LppU/SCO3897 family protein [Peterkaempfera griseoplana]
MRSAGAGEPGHAAVGECIHVAGAKDNPNVSTVACTDDNADYTVVRVVENSTATGTCNNLSDTALKQQSGSRSYVLCVNKKTS